MGDQAKSCPLCGGPNDCGLARGGSKCWCFFVPVSEEALAAVPQDDVNKRCICKACASGKQSPTRVEQLLRELHRRR